jgi:anti-anti-sigma factor
VVHDRRVGPDTTRRDDTHLIILRGEIDLARETELAAIQADYQQTGTANVQVDLTQVTFIDATGVNFLVRLENVASERGGTVRLTGVSQPLAKLFAICCLNRFDSRSSGAALEG